MFKQTVLNIILLLACINLYSQQPRTDSIIDNISSFPDTVQINLLKECAINQRDSSLKSGLKYANKLLEIANKLDSSRLIAETWHLFGNLYTSSGLLADAEDNYLKSLSIYDSLELYDLQASVLHNLGLVNHRQKDTLNSIHYYQRSIEVRKTKLSDIRTGDELTTLGEVYLSLGRFENSLNCLGEALKYYTGVHSYPRKTEAFAYLFDNYHISDIPNSMKWLDSMKVANSILKSEIYDNMIKLRLCKYYIRNNDPVNAGLYIDSIDFNKLYEFEVFHPLDVFLHLSDMYKTKGKQKESIKHLLTYHNKMEENMEQEVRDLVSNYNIRLSIRSSEDELESTRQQNEIILEKLRKEKTISLIIYFALGITIIILIILARNAYLIRRTNRKLLQRKEMLQDAVSRSIKYKDRALKIHQNKNIFFSMISLKLNTPFKVITESLEKINSYLLSENKDLRLKKMLEKLYNDASAIEKDLEKILLWSKLQRNKYSIKKDIINLNEFFHEILPDMLRKALRKDIRIRFDIDPEITVSFDRESLKTIISIFADNSIEYSSPGSDIILRSQTATKGSIVSLTDFGAGIDGNMQNKLFDINRIIEQDINPDNKKIGLSLLIARLLAEINGALVSFESKKDSGTTFFLHINSDND